VRVRGAGQKQVVLPVAQFVARLSEELQTRALVPAIR